VIIKTVNPFLSLFILLSVVSGVVFLFSGCTSTKSAGPGTEEIAADLVEQIAPAFPDNSRVLILGFYESDGEELHRANDALSSELAIELLKISDRNIKVVNRNMLEEALNELKFSLSELTNSEKAQELGGFLSADIIIKGVVSQDFVTVECTEVETLTLVSIGKYTASQRMAFATDSSTSAAPTSTEQQSLHILADAGIEIEDQFDVVFSSFESEYGIKVRYEETPSLADRIDELKFQDALPDIVFSPHPAIATSGYPQCSVICRIIGECFDKNN